MDGHSLEGGKVVVDDVLVGSGHEKDGRLEEAWNVLQKRTN